MIWLLLIPIAYIVAGVVVARVCVAIDEDPDEPTPPWVAAFYVAAWPFWLAILIGWSLYKGIAWLALTPIPKPGWRRARRAERAAAKTAEIEAEIARLASEQDGGDRS